MKWKHFPRFWPFVRGIHRSPVNSPHKGQWRGPLVFSLICAWINGWVINREAGGLKRLCAHYDVTVIWANISSGYGLLYDGKKPLSEPILTRDHCCSSPVNFTEVHKICWQKGSVENIFYSLYAFTEEGWIDMTHLWKEFKSFWPYMCRHTTMGFVFVKGCILIIPLFNYMVVI